VSKAGAVGRVRASAAAVLACVCLLAATASPARAQPADQAPHDPAANPGPEMLLRAFGSVDWAATERPGSPSSFTLGQFDLFVTAALNERVSVLAEIVLEASGVNTQVVTDLERLQLTFRVDDFLQFSAGRYHTGIGFYNTAFHHGSYFETPIGRPRIFDFEDEGGVLPVHELGLSTRGAVPHTSSALQYLAEVGNGRSWTPEATENSEGDEASESRDQNGAKSSNVGLSFRPALWRGLEVGASFYRDEVRDPTGANVRLRIPAAYAVYRTRTAEVMAEWVHVAYRTAAGAASANDGQYVQASNAWGKLRPYYRFDRLAIDPLSPFIGGVGSSRSHIFGLRADPAMWIGLKAQYERSNEAGLRGIDSVRTQLVFVF
jgi:hypothetical protein